MLSDRISAVLETMEVTISDVARAGGCTPSNLNRIKNGVRTPQPASPTIRYFTDGIIEIARQRNRVGELCSLCGANLRDSEDTVRTKLIEWLYEDEPPYIRTYNKKNTGRSDAGRMISTMFSKRLDDLLKLSGYSNRRLGAEVGLDPSYVSRLRRGERIPRYSSPYLMQICESILERITAEGKLPQLYDLTSMSEVEVTEKDAADGLRRWLFGYGPVTGYMAADELLGTISSIDKIMQASPAQTSVQDALDRILEQSEQNCTFAENVSEMRYVGVDGIRAAVTRFLSDMIRDGDLDMLLYSDQSMEWMGGDYSLTLKVLMTELIRRGVRIRIIHTVDRSMPELISALEWWMPLYISGNVTSYYCRRSSGKLFSHTMFIRPGAACIVGTSAIGFENRAVFHYSTDAEIAELSEEAFRCILEESIPLVDICECNAEALDSTGDGFVSAGTLQIRASLKEVKIRRTEPPHLMFTFTHPMLCKAFRAVSAAWHD